MVGLINDLANSMLGIAYRVRNMLSSHGITDEKTLMKTISVSMDQAGIPHELMKIKWDNGKPYTLYAYDKGTVVFVTSDREVIACYVRDDAQRFDPMYGGLTQAGTPRIYRRSKKKGA